MGKDVIKCLATANMPVRAVTANSIHRTPITLGVSKLGRDAARLVMKGVREDGVEGYMQGAQRPSAGPYLPTLCCSSHIRCVLETGNQVCPLGVPVFRGAELGLSRFLAIVATGADAVPFQDSLRNQFVHA